MLKTDTLTVFGTDPEGFFSINGRIVGSEKLIPEKGLVVGRSGKIVRDGVQFELNPTIVYYGQSLTEHVGQLLLEADKIAKQNGASISFDGVVEVAREELDSLSPKCRVLGCQPSLNTYGVKPITVDVNTYQKRSAGGHIHLGVYYTMKPLAKRIIPVCDILVGNTCVLLDRDPNAAERRENYGRAGEYRLPTHGVEYRTLSNFWLRSPILTNFVFGLARTATSLFIEVAHYKSKTPWNDLADLVTLPNFEKAINTNDFDLALQNLKGIEKFYRTHVPAEYPLNGKNFERFISFAEAVRSKGLDTFFPTTDIEKSWSSNNRNASFSTFLDCNT